MNIDYSKLVKQFVEVQKRKAGYMCASRKKEKESFLAKQLNALYIAFKQTYPNEVIIPLEKELEKYNFIPLPSDYSIQKAKQFLISFF